MTLDMAAKRTLTARLKRYDVCFWQILLQKSKIEQPKKSRES